MVLILATAFQPGLNAQSLTGIWRGYFITDYGERYKLEFQINGTTPNFSSGVSYSYLDVRFYGKATMTGSFTKTSKNLKIREIKTVEIKNMDGGGACIMNYDLFYSKSETGREEFLEGTFLGKPEVKNKPNPYNWGDCGGGKVFLRKVTTSDFYIEPFLRGKVNPRPVIINQPPIKKDTARTKQVVVNKPPAKTVVTTKPTVTKPSVNKPVVKTTPLPPPVVKTKTDTANTKITNPVIKTIPTAIVPKPAVLKNRQNELMKSLVVTNPEVVVRLYDNGEIDDDTISVYLDNKLVLTSKRLTAAPLTIRFTFDEDGSDHELVMVAENLGRIPPNTSLMIVESGEQRFDVRITSTTQKNAVVRFRYQKPR